MDANVGRRLRPRHPDLGLEIAIDDGPTEIVAERYDAGVRLPEPPPVFCVSQLVNPARPAGIKERMSRSLCRFTVLLALALAPLYTRADPGTDVGATAFVDVNVVPMDSERVLQRQTVLVQEGRISAIGRDLPLPPGTRIISGHGRAYLSPGLADMHTHSATRADLAVYLANGVTTVLNMGGASSEFMDGVRPAVNEGRIPGPHVYAAFRVDGSPRYGNFVVTTPDEARAVVALARTNGYDFIKVYNDLSPECFAALIEAGQREHMAIVGHGITRVGLERQLAAGQVLVAHTEEFLYTTFGALGDAAPSAALIPGAIAFIRRSGAYVTADLNTYQTIARQWGQPRVLESLMHEDAVRYVSPAQRLAWRAGDYSGRPGTLAAKVAFLRRFTRAMSDAGVPLVTGTDAPSIAGLAPGYSLHQDLRALQEAGLTRYQALAAATRVPGEFVHAYVPGSDRFGTVAPGSRADLVLSAANPLADLSTLGKPVGVMARGTWYPAARLRQLLHGVAARYDAACARP